MKPRKRITFEDKSVLAYMFPGERYADAKKRLDEAWKNGQHPVQIKEKRSEE